jgi:hypothetical protein
MPETFEHKNPVPDATCGVQCIPYQVDFCGGMCHFLGPICEDLELVYGFWHAVQHDVVHMEIVPSYSGVQKQPKKNHKNREFITKSFPPITLPHCTQNHCGSIFTNFMFNIQRAGKTQSHYRGNPSPHQETTNIGMGDTGLREYGRVPSTDRSSKILEINKQVLETRRTK